MSKKKQPFWQKDGVKYDPGEVDPEEVKEYLKKLTESGKEYDNFLAPPQGTPEERSQYRKYEKPDFGKSEDELSETVALVAPKEFSEAEMDKIRKLEQGWRKRLEEINTEKMKIIQEEEEFKRSVKRSIMGKDPRFFAGLVHEDDTLDPFVLRRMFPSFYQEQASKLKKLEQRYKASIDDVKSALAEISNESPPVFIPESILKQELGKLVKISRGEGEYDFSQELDLKGPITIGTAKEEMDEDELEEQIRKQDEDLEKFTWFPTSPEKGGEEPYDQRRIVTEEDENEKAWKNAYGEIIEASIRFGIVKEEGLNAKVRENLNQFLAEKARPKVCSGCCENGECSPLPIFSSVAGRKCKAQICKKRGTLRFVLE
jgi:hypothetical protein